MAKKSVIAREIQKAEVVRKYGKKSAAIKQKIREAILAEQASGDEDGGESGGVFEACLELSKLPRNHSKCRLNKRCRMCGRPRGVYRSFGLCRVCLRQAAQRGDIPGMVKASW